MFNVILFDLGHFYQKVDGFHIYKEKPSQNVSKRAKIGLFVWLFYSPYVIDKLGL